MVKLIDLTATIIFILNACCFGQNNSSIGQEELESIDNFAYTILCDNISMTDSIFADHGFSCLIESGDYTCLYDAGNDSEKFMANVEKTKVDCSGIDFVFISHIHNDHVGGLSDILDKCNKPALCMPVSYPRQEGESFGEQADKEYETMLDQLRPFVSELYQHKTLANFGANFYTSGIIEKQSYEQALILPTARR